VDTNLNALPEIFENNAIITENTKKMYQIKKNGINLPKKNCFLLRGATQSEKYNWTRITSDIKKINMELRFATRLSKV
jgi:hypothetical protein